jgi:hypothetical protein
MNHMRDRGLRSAAGVVCAAAVLIGAIVVAGGCANQPKPIPQTDAGALQPAHGESVTPVQGQESPASPRDGEVTPDQMEASAGTPDALARKAETYSREMENLLARRPTQAPAPAPAEPSQVKWADPSDFRLGHVSSTAGGARTPPPPPSPLVRPAIETSPSQANQVASITPMPDQNLVDGNASANAPARADDPTTKPSTSASSLPRTAVPMSASSTGLSDKFATRVRDYPRDVSAHLEYQLLQFLLDEQVPQLTVLAALPNEDRELVTAVLDGLTLFRNTLRSDNNMLLSKKIRPLIDMSDRLRSQADLTIPTVALCKSVEGFAKYDPIDPARFAAGAEHKAIVYCEVANFMSNLNDKHQWETRLRQELVLYMESGVPVWNDRTDTIVDTARNRRHDFFINKRIVIPGNLAVGRYLLKVSIIDEQANRVAEQTVPIVIAAK